MFFVKYYLVKSIRGKGGLGGYWVRGGQVWEKPERANLLLVREDWDVIES